MDIRKLRDRFSGEIVSEEETLRSASTDFGRLMYRMPSAIAAPKNRDDVQSAVEVANEEEWTIAVRGAAHSQAGQSLGKGSLALDMTSLNEIGEVEEDSVWVGAGLLWSDLFEELAPRGLVPPVLTNNLNVTVGGTLSMGGLGVSSHRYGPQVGNVEALEVVTGTGDFVRCSAGENSQLFECARGGLGQFGIITRARLKLRKFLPNVRTYYLLYDDLDALIHDQKMMIRESRFDFVEAWCTPCMQGIKRLGETRVPFAEWFYPMHLSFEFGDAVAPADSLLSNLHYYRRTHTEDISLSAYFRRMENVFQLWREMGTWNLAHPWMEALLPWDRSVEYLRGILKSFPPHLLNGGQVLLWPCRASDLGAGSLFVQPVGDYYLGLGILPSVPRQLVAMTVSLLNKASDLVTQVGGKRYLSGWVEFDHRRWKAHLGDQWDVFLQCKEFFDPNGVLNPGFVNYSEADD